MQGLPDNAMEAHAVRQDSLPSNGVVGLLDNRGRKVRMAFKRDERLLLVASAESTQRFPYGSVVAVQSEPLPDDPSRTILTLEVGKERNKYFFYFFPANYVRALKTELEAWL